MAKKIDLNTSKDLIALRESLDKKLDREIRRRQLKESLSNIKHLNLGVLKHIFESTIKDVNNKKSLRLIKEYITTIKGNKDLKSSYQLYENILKVPSDTDASIISNMVDSSCYGINSKHVFEGEKKLLKIVKEGILNSDLTVDGLNELLGHNKTLNEAVDFLLKNQRKPKNLLESTQSLKSIYNFITENKVESKENTDKLNYKSTVSQLNDTLSESANEWEKRVISDIALCELSGKSKETLFEEYKNKCISTIDSLIGDRNIEDKSKFSLMKEQIGKKSYNEETFNDDMLKLSELHETLNNEI